MRAGVGQGITNAINNYDQGVEAGDAAEMRKLQMQQLKKAIAQQDAAALANLNDQAKASKVQEPVSWDADGNPLDSTGAVIPIRSQQSQQGPQAPNPGQASVPNPANQPQRPAQQQPMQQGAMPPPQQQPQPNQMQQRPPIPQQAPQGQPMPPPQQPQMQAPPKPQIPPYVNPAQLQAKPPSAPQPQIGNVAPPAMGMPPNVQGLIGEAKQISQKEASMWDAYTKLISEPDKPTPIEKKLAYYQSQGLTTQQALKYKLNLSPDKYYETVEKERTKQDVQKKIKLDAIDKMINSQQTGKKNDAEIAHWSAEDKDRIVKQAQEWAKIGIERSKEQRAKEADTLELRSASGALLQNGDFSNWNIKQTAKAVADVKQKYPQLSESEIVEKANLARELNKERQSQLLQQGKVVGFEKTALGNLDQIMKQIDEQRKSGKTDIPALNSLLTKYNTMTGTAYKEGTELFGKEASSELAKLASSASGAGAGGTLQDREEWNSFFKENGSYAQMKKAVDSAKTAVNIRIKSTKDSIDDTSQQIKYLWPDGKSGISKNPMPLEDYLKSKGY